jgi:hypothetical protein
MCVFAGGIKRPFDLPIERPQHADARVHQKVAALSGADQATDRGLPFLEILPGLGKFHDVVGGIAQSHELAPTRQLDWIIERTEPGGSQLRSCDQLSAFRNVLNVQFAFSSAGPGAAISGQIVVLS